jgi:hypothetical protein
MQRGELNRLPVGFGQPGDHRREAGRQLGFRRAHIFGVRRSGDVALQRVCAAVSTLARAHRIPERVARDLKEPGFHPVAIPQ